MLPMSEFEAGRFPATRLRRTRRTAALRRLVAETGLSASDLVWPVFVREEETHAREIASMPGAKRHTVDELIDALGPAVELGICAVALFPVIDPDNKSPDGA